jgi:hypothetical protein
MGTVLKEFRDLLADLAKVNFPVRLEPESTVSIDWVQGKNAITIPSNLRKLLLTFGGDLSDSGMFSFLSPECRLLSCQGIDSVIQRIRNADAFSSSILDSPQSDAWKPSWVPFISSPYFVYIISWEDEHIRLIDHEALTVSKSSRSLAKFFNTLRATLIDGQFSYISPPGYWTSSAPQESLAHPGILCPRCESAFIQTDSHEKSACPVCQFTIS